MTLPTFNLDEVLSDRAQYIGELPWLNTAPVQIQTIAPKKDEPEKAIVVTATQHGLLTGEKVFVGGYSPTVDHFYIVEEHPEKQHKKTAFLIDLALQERLGPGSLYAPETFSILHPKHISMQANIEMQSLELRQLEVLKVVSPKNYQKTMLLLLKSMGDSNSANNIKKDIENLVKKIGNSSDGEEIQPEALSRIQQIELDIMIREIEILCSMPVNHMKIMANKAGMGKVIKQIHGFIGGLISTADMERESPDELQAMISKVESALAIPKDRLQITKHFGLVDIIKKMHQFVVQAEAEDQADEDQPKPKKPQRTRKPLDDSGTIVKAS